MSFWTWIRNPDNQKTLAFIGAGIAGIIGFLTQMGLFEKEKPTPVIAPPVAAPAAVPTPAAPPASQTAEARDGGTAFNVSGSGHTVNVPSRR